MDEEKWNNFMEFLQEVKEGRGPEAFAPSKNGNITPQTWEELIERVKNLAGDDPITWLPLNKEA